MSGPPGTPLAQADDVVALPAGVAKRPPVRVAQSAGAGIDRRAVRRRLLVLTGLVIVAATLMLAVPGLRDVLDRIDEMSGGWVAAAVALEIASCVSFVVIFRQFFDRLPTVAAHELAWTQMGSGALLPGGGVGGLAIGGWLLHRFGMSTRRIVQRSSGLFFLTSATNVLTLGGAGGLLVLGIASGPHDVLRAGLPIVGAVVATAVVLAVPTLSHRLSPGGSRRRLLADLSDGITMARHAVRRPTWRLLGAAGYLLFDIGALWAALSALGTSPPVAAIMVAYLVGYLANALPIPGGVGALDVGLTGALVLYGESASTAAAAVLVYHAIAFWIPSAGGLLAFGLVQRRLAGDVPAAAMRVRAPLTEPALLAPQRSVAPRSDRSASSRLAAPPVGSPRGRREQRRGHAATNRTDDATAW